MNKTVALFVVLSIVSLTQFAVATDTADIRVYFSPQGGCTDAIVREISHAKTNLLMQAYSFTSEPIAQALIAAKKRGVDVQVLLDKSVRRENYAKSLELFRVGIRMWVDDKHSIAHNKVMVIDDETLITGSFNFTNAAERNNAENLLIIRDSAIAQKYARNWREHKAHSNPYDGRHS